jgi:hypothetical protein
MKLDVNLKNYEAREGLGNLKPLMRVQIRVKGEHKVRPYGIGE